MKFAGVLLPTILCLVILVPGITAPAAGGGVRRGSSNSNNKPRGFFNWNWRNQKSQEESPCDISCNDFELYRVTRNKACNVCCKQKNLGKSGGCSFYGFRYAGMGGIPRSPKCKCSA